MPEVTPSTPPTQLPLMPPVPTATAPAPKPVKRFELPPEPAAAPVAPAAESAPQAPQNTGEQATPAVPEGEAPESKEAVTPEQAAKREGRRFERRLDKAYRKAAEAQARADLLQKQLDESRQSAQPKEEGKPTLEQFDFDPDKFAQAVAKFELSKADKERAAKQRDETIKQTQERLASSWEEKAEKGADKYDDWTDIVGEIQPGTAMTDAIMDAENGDDVAYYLGKNPKEAERIAKLPWFSQIREIGKIEAKLLSQPEKPKTPSKAPAPITPVSTAAPALPDTPSENDDMKSWMRKRQKQVHGRG